jgi:Tol biopolymer transport system component
MLKHTPGGLLGSALLLLTACSAEPPPAAAPAIAEHTPAPQASALQASQQAAPTLAATIVPTVAPAAAATATSEAQPTAAAAASPSATLQPAVRFTQLTKDNCCVQPFFSADGARVLFLDRPAPALPVGIYGVAVDQPMTQPTLVTEKLGPFSRDLAYSVSLVNGQTVIEQAQNPETGAAGRWVINNGGRNVSFSPDATRILWSVSEEAGGFDRRRSDLWLANIDGSDAKRIVTRFGGGAVAWLPDGQRILLGGRPNRNDAKPTLSIFDLRDGSMRDLFTAERWRGVSVAPDGKRLLYFIAQAREDGLGGVYLLDLTQATPAPARLDFFGAYRWRDATRLLYVPITLNTPSNELWQFDTTTGTAERLIDASETSSFKIGNGDWDVAPDGKQLVFLNARDRNLWLVTLP